MEAHPRVSRLRPCIVVAHQHEIITEDLAEKLHRTRMRDQLRDRATAKLHGRTTSLARRVVYRAGFEPRRFRLEACYALSREQVGNHQIPLHLELPQLTAETELRPISIIKDVFSGGHFQTCLSGHATRRSA